MKPHFNHILWVFLVVQTLYVLLSIGFPFFWDAAYHAQVALNIYENNFNTVFPDLDTDAGHPVLFNIYLALGWKILGKNLIVSHLLQLPFVWGYVYFVWKFIQKYIPQKNEWIAVILLCAEATLTAQTMSLNPDIALLCAFFMALYGIDTKKTLFIIIGTVLLSLLSIRGWIMGIALFCIDLANNRFDVKQLKNYVRNYILFTLMIVLWLFLHHFYTGRWFASEMYKSEFSWKIVPKNAVVFVFRLVDTGRIALWITVLWLLWYTRKSMFFLLFQTHFLLQSVVVTLLIFFILFVPLTNPIGHRYFMVIYVLLILWVVKAISEAKVKKWIFGIIGAFFIVGHFWVYPVPMANGWDSSLAHISYFRLKDNLLQYAKNQNIPFSQIYTYPPLHKSAYITQLSTKKTENLPLLNDKNWDIAPYILYSNISNNFNQKEQNLLQKNYIPLFTQKNGFVKCILYQKNK
jgi:hypothetical protein